MLYAACLTAFMAVMMAGFAHELHLQVERPARDLPAALMFFDRFLIEFLAVMLLGLWLVNGHAALRALAYLLAAVFMTAYAVQWIALARAGELVSTLALENLNHVRLVLSAPIVLGLAALLAVIVGVPWLIERRGRTQRYPWRGLALGSLALAAAGLTLAAGDAWLPPASLEARDDYLRINNLRHTSPAAELYRVLFGQADVTAGELSREAMLEAEKYGFRLRLDRPYPLLRQEIYRSPAPFPSRDGASDRPNVIVFFAEGLSARTINRHGSQVPGLTPNIDDFAGHALVVEDYYNHTAATYRGLHGSLCSLFPKYGGVGGWHTNYRDLPDTKYFCLSHYFGGQGYRTVFFDTHKREAGFVDEMMARLSFDRVLTAEDLAAYLDGARPLRFDALSDHQLIDAFVGYLKAHESTAVDGRPLFCGLYNLETHAWQDVAADGVKYGDGGHRTFNTVHNFDHAFGRFWSYFRSSPWAENTVVVLTSDHAHYHEKPYAEAMRREDPTYQRLFVDRIPLMIHDPTRVLPATWGAGFATSIDFAPSLVHFLGAPNTPHAFLGNSIFEADRDRIAGFGVASIGDELFLIDATRIHSLQHAKFFKPNLELLDEFVDKLKELEQNDRLWDVELGQ